MPRVLEEAAVAGFDHDGRGLSQYLLETDRADLALALRAALVHLADRPDPLTVEGMAKTPAQQKRVRDAWKTLVLGLVQADK
jgi:hypothetical protein